MASHPAPVQQQQPRRKRVRLEEQPTTSDSETPVDHRTGDIDTPGQHGNSRVQPIAKLDDSGLRRYLTSRDEIFMEAFSDKMAGLHKVIADLRGEVGDVRYELILVKAHVDILMLMGEADGTANGVVGGRTDLSTRCDTLLTHFSLIFRPEVITKVVMTSIVYCLTAGGASCDDHPSSRVDCHLSCVSKAGSVIVAYLLFGKRANMSKMVLHSGVGKEYCKMRKFIVLSLIRNAQANSFGQFNVPSGMNTAVRNRVRESTPAALVTATSTDQVPHVSPGCIPQPMWIRPNVITNLHVEQVRSRLEKKMEKQKIQQSKKKNKDAQPTDEDVSLRAVDRIYSRVTGHLHKSRDRARTLFFDEIGYVLVQWSEHSLPEHLEEPILSWAYEEGKDATLPVPSVPMTSVMQRAEMMQSRDKENSRLLGSFLEQSLYMVVVVEHDVSIVRDVYMADQTRSPLMSSAPGTGSTANVAHTVRKRVRRLINLVEVALKFLNAYSGSSLDSSIVTILGTDASVLKAAFVMASTFRSAVQSFMDSANLRLDSDSSVSTPPSTSSTGSEAMSLCELLPTPSMRQKTFVKMVLGMTEADYEVYNVPIPQDYDSLDSPPSRQGDCAEGGSDDIVEGLDFVLCT